jgi:hypothetical protein
MANSIQNNSIFEIDAGKILNLTSDKIVIRSGSSATIFSSWVNPDEGSTAIYGGAIAAHSIQLSKLTGNGIDIVGDTTTINGGAITTNSISANQLLSNFIVSNTFKTADSGQRVEFNSNGIFGYNSSNQEQFALRASNGKAYFSGRNAFLGYDGLVFNGNSGMIQFFDSLMHTVLLLFQRIEDN